MIVSCSAPELAPQTDLAGAQPVASGPLIEDVSTDLPASAWTAAVPLTLVAPGGKNLVVLDKLGVRVEVTQIRQGRILVQCTGCEGTIGDISGCSQANRAEVAIQNFDPRNDVIIIDAQTLFQGTDVSTNTEDTLSGCMSITTDADCNSLFENMGLNLETGEPESVANFFRVGS